MKRSEVRLLLVDDDDLDVIAVSRAFAKARIANEIVRAVDGLEALEILRGEHTRSTMEPPFIILLDLNMPRMNGIEFLEEVRKDRELKKSIIFVLTTSKADEDMARAYEHNIAGYIVKENAGEDFINLISMTHHFWRIVELPE